MKKVLFTLFALLMAVSLLGGLLAGCSGTKTTTSTTSGLKEVNILIGVTSPLTGGAAPFGLSQQHGVELAFEDLNNAGGIVSGDTHYTFTVKSLDDSYDPTKASDNIRTLVNQDGSKFLFTFESASELALAPTLAQQKVIQFVVVYDDKILDNANTYTFRSVIPPSIKVHSFTQYLMTKYPNAKKMAHLSANNITSTIQTQQDVAEAQAAGLTVTDQIFVDQGTTDFTPFLTKILSKNPDILNLGGTSVGDVAVIVKQARAMGYKGVICNISPCSATDMISIASASDLEGFISTNVAMEAPLVSQKFLDLPAREKAKFGDVYGNTWDFYSMASVMVAAMQRTKSVDPTVIKNILEDTTQVWPYEMFVGGKATFGTSVAKTLFANSLYNHQMMNSYTISVIKNGKDTNAKVITP